METKIGEAAGTVWRYLDAHGSTTLSGLRQGTELPDRLLHMALGWLAREGKLELVEDRRGLRIALRRPA